MLAGTVIWIHFEGFQSEQPAEGAQVEGYVIMDRSEKTSGMQVAIWCLDLKNIYCRWYRAALGL